MPEEKFLPIPLNDLISKNFYLQFFFSCGNDCIEDMATFTAVVKIKPTNVSVIQR